MVAAGHDLARDICLIGTFTRPSTQTGSFVIVVLLGGDPSVADGLLGFAEPFEAGYAVLAVTARRHSKLTLTDRK